MAKRFILRSFELAFGLAFFAAFAHHVVRGEFRPLVAMSVPLLVVFYGFASVLFVRGRSLAKGAWQTRSIYAAERAIQAAVLYLVGIVLGVVVYGAVKRLDGELWLLLFLAPYAFMQVALIAFMRGLWALAPDLFRDRRAMQLVRRVRQA